MEDLKKDIILLEGRLRNPRLSIEKKIDVLLKTLEIDLQGDNYLKDALLFCLEDRNYLRTMAKRLYPKIAKKYHSNVKTIQDQIRFSVKKLASNENSEKLKYIRIYVLGYAIEECKMLNIDVIYSLINFLDEVNL